MEGKNSNTVQAFWVAIGSFSTFMVSIISAAILSRYFDKTDYGTYRQILFVYNTLLVIFTAGLPRIFEYYLPRYTKPQGKDIVFKVSKMLFFCGLAFSSVLYLFSDLIADALNNAELARGLKYFSPIPMLLLPTLGIEGIFTSYKKTKYIAQYNVITRILMLIGIITPVIFFNGDYISAIIGWGIVSVFILIIGWYFKNIAFRGVTEHEKSNLSFREIFVYSIPLVIASLAGIAIKSADQFYISRYFGPEVFAEYANGFMELPFVTMITGATSAVIMPLFSKMFFLKEGTDDLVDTWCRALIKSAIFIYPLVVFFIAFSQDIMTILYTSKYSMSGFYFQINLVLNFFNIVIFAPLFFSMGKTSLYAKVHIVLAIFIWIFDFFLIKIFMSPIAIALSSTTLQILKTFYFLFVASKLLNVKFFKFFPLQALLKLVVHAGIIAIVVLFLEREYQLSHHPLIQLSLYACFYGILILITAPLFKIDYLGNLLPIFKSLRNKVTQ